MLQRVDAAKVEQTILAIQEQMRGPAPKEQLIVLDGKEPRHGRQRLDFERGHRTEPALLGQCTGGSKDQRDSGGTRVI